jgi:hypothetical protein
MTQLILSMYELDTNILQLRLQFTVLGLPKNWNTRLAQPGVYPIITDPNDSNCIQSLKFTAEAPHTQSGFVNCSNFSANDNSFCNFNVYSYDEDPRANATKCFTGKIKALCTYNTDSTFNCTYTNFLFMNSSKMYAEHYYNFSNDGVFRTDTSGDHDNVYYAYNSTNSGKKPYYYYMTVEPTVLTAVNPSNHQIMAVPRMSMKSLFSNNAQVFYKPHSLSSGSGGVTNSRLKKRKT